MCFLKRKNTHFDTNEKKYVELKTGSNLGPIRTKKKKTGPNRFQQVYQNHSQTT